MLVNRVRRRVNSAVEVPFEPAVVWPTVSIRILLTAQAQVSDQNGLLNPKMHQKRMAFISSNGEPHKLGMLNCKIMYKFTFLYKGARICKTETGRLKTAQNPLVYQPSFLFTSHHFQGMTDIPFPSPSTHTPRCSQQ